MEALRLHWLGTPFVEFKGREVKLETRKATALLAYISSSDERYSREGLAAMLWPEKNQQQALGNLRRTLASLNATLPGRIQADRDTIALKQDRSTWSDLAAFHDELLLFKKHAHAEGELCDEGVTHLEKALHHYRGDFLEGLNLNDCTSFDDWQFYQRDGLRQELAGLLEELATAYGRRQQSDEAIACARRWYLLDRLHEPASRLLMELYSEAGEKSAALRQYEELEKLLREQVNQEPEEATRELAERLRAAESTKGRLPAHEDEKSQPLLKTKLYIPTKPSSHIERGELAKQMEQAAKKPLTIISAPAGFGKTTLLAEWIEKTQLPVAWLSLDAGDNDTYRFMAYLIAAFESLQEEAGAEARLMMRAGTMTPPHIVLASLINELGKATEPMVLVLDDIQFITNAGVHEALGYLLDHLPANLHIVMATRADPPLQLGRLRAHDQLLELRIQDLRFTAQESAQLLNEAMKLGLSGDEIGALHLRTEGWVVGLKMAALSLSNHENPGEFIEAFSGSQRYVLDYLMEEVLRRQPEYIQEFLLNTCILDKLSGPLCDALMTEAWRKDGRNGQNVLEYLERSNLFLIPLDDHKQWYRYHHLFADLLRARLEQAQSQAVPQLYGRASQWFEEHDFYNEAVEHALLSKNYERSAALLDRSSQTRVLLQPFMVMHWIEQVPEEIISQHPWIQVSLGWLLLAMGKLERVPELLEKAEKVIASGEDGSLDESEAEDIRGNAAMLRAYMAFFRGDPRRTLELASVALKKVRPSNIFLRSRILLQLGESSSVLGQLPTGINYLHEAIASSTKEADYSVATVAYFRLGNILKIMGRLAEAEERYRQNIKALKEMGGYDSPMLGKPEIGTGDLLRERGELEEARELLRSGHKHMERQGQPYDLVYSYIHQARLAEAEGNIQQAQELVSQTESIFQAYTVPPVVRMLLDCYQVALWLRLGRLRQADQWITDHKLTPETEMSYAMELPLITLCRVMISQGKLVEAQELLSRLESAARDGERNGRALEILILRALAFEETGEFESARNVLGQALDIAEPEGFFRIFLDEGDAMVRLLEQACKSETATARRDYLQRLLLGNKTET